jgi:hypothetical protein
VEDEEAKRIQEERDKQLTEEYKELQNPKRPDEKQLLGSQLLDNIGGKFTEAGSAVMEAAQEDPDTWTDDAIRIGLGGVKNVGTVLGAPGIKQGLQLLGAPAYYVGRGLGYGLEKAGVDPRYGHIVGEVGEWFIPGYGMYKAAGKVSKYSKIAGSAALSDAAALMARQNPMIASGAGAVPPGGELGNLIKSTINPIGFGPFGKHLKSMSPRGRPRKPFKNRLLGERILDSSTDGTLTEKIEHALKIDKSRGFKARIPKKALDKGKSQVDEAAAIDKNLIRKFIKPYPHTEADVLDIYNKTKEGFKDYSKTRTWLNKYFDELSKGLEDLSAAKPGDPPLLLKDVEINTVKNAAGELEPRLVVKVTGEEVNIDAFHVDHRAAKVKLSQLGIRGADVYENLDIVYGVFNTSKNYAGNPMLPREFHMALGESFGLQEFVSRSMSKEFNSRFTKIPQEVRELVRESMIQDLLESKGTQTDIKRIVARQIDLYSNPKYQSFVTDLIDKMQTPPKRIRIEQYDAIMEDIEILLRHIDNKQHQLRYEELIEMPIWHMMPKEEQIKFINLHDQYVTRKRGLGAQFKSKQGKYYSDGHDV